MSCFTSICCGGEEEETKYGSVLEGGWGSDDYYGDDTDNNHKPTTNTNGSRPDVTRRNMFSESALPTTQSDTNEKPFHQIYELGPELGQGNFALVREGYKTKSAKEKENTTFAIKIVDRTKLTKGDEKALQLEIQIQKDVLRHPNIIGLHETYHEPATHYLVLELVKGGELFDRIVQKEHYNEKEARDVLKIILEAMSYCHRQKVAHRDLKPENLLLSSTTDDTAIKIADFGFAKVVPSPSSLTTQCGTPNYVAPEILNSLPYDERADNWSLGVIAYIILGGYPPFNQEPTRALFRAIRAADYEFHEEYWGTVSKEAKDFIRSLMHGSVSVRSTAQQALQHEWISGMDDSKLVAQNLGFQFAAIQKVQCQAQIQECCGGDNGYQQAYFIGRKLSKTSIARMHFFCFGPCLLHFLAQNQFWSPGFKHPRR